MNKKLAKFYCIMKLKNKKLFPSKNKSFLNEFWFSNNNGIRFDYEKRNKNVE